MDKIDVSIIIVNYNTAHVLGPCLDSVKAMTQGMTYEIIVVDNGSTDGSVERFSNDSRINFIESGANLGFGKANNLGVDFAKGEYVLFLNSDTFLRNNAIKIMLDFARQYGDGLGALGTILENSDGNPIHSYGKLPRMHDDWQDLVVVPLQKALGLYHEQPSRWPDVWEKVGYVTGADLLVPQKVLRQCGAFHPAFFMYFEEAEMQRRFQRACFDSILMRGPRIVHLEGEGGKTGGASKFLRDTLRQEKSRFIYFKLTEPRWKYWIYRVVHPILRQTLWLNPNVSLSDKWKLMKQLFVSTKI